MSKLGLLWRSYDKLDEVEECIDMLEFKKDLTNEENEKLIYLKNRQQTLEDMIFRKLSIS